MQQEDRVGFYDVSPNTARWSDHASGIDRSSTLTVRDRGCRPSTMASRISGARYANRTKPANMGIAETKAPPNLGGVGVFALS